MHRKALGKGLEALIPSAATETMELPKTGVREISIEDVGANPHQPRTRFDDDSLRELADSIQASGVLQPVIVRRTDDGGYQLGPFRGLDAPQTLGRIVVRPPPTAASPRSSRRSMIERCWSLPSSRTFSVRT